MMVWVGVSGEFKICLVVCGMRVKNGIEMGYGMKNRKLF